MSKAKPWVVDAAEVHGEDPDPLGQQSIHETAAIREFLSQDGHDRLYVVAPKGYGKTLLLQAKRMLLQRERKGVILSPSGQLVDRPPSALPIWTKEDLESFVRSYEYWVEAWEIAVKVAAVKLFRRHAGHGSTPEAALMSGLRSPRLREILGKPQFEVLSEIFMQVLHLDRREFYALRQDVITHLNPMFRGIHKGIAFFIDNVDECLERSLKGIRAGEPRAYPSGHPWRLPEPWTLAQLALARAAFDINRLNSHVRVYAALRREAWLRLGDFDAGAAQMNGRVVEIRYSREDLREIFLKNIAVESPDRLCDRAAGELLARFVGPQNVSIVHDLTGDREDFFDFVLRHTLLRPRELMAIGGQISLIPPAQRTAARLKDAVRRAAADNVRFYQAEMSLFMPAPDRTLFRLIDRNALGADDLARISDAYSRILDAAEGGASAERRHPFSALYRMGLLGVLRSTGEASSGEEPGEHQRFIRPDEIAFEERLGVLPRSRRYLVHPALDTAIEDSHGADYARNSERRNIVGAMLPWAEEAISHYVLAGDIVGSTETAWNPDYGATYPAMFAGWVEEICDAHGVRHHEVRAGDSVLMVDAGAARLLLAARHLLARMRRLKEHRRTMRFGAARGVVRGLDDVRAGAARPLTGSVLSTAARLEKAARQGTVLATDEFWEGARGAWDEAIAVRLDADFKGFRNVDGKFLVQKTRQDPVTVTGLWRIRLLADE
jgi:class 3 adenylate cyclase